MEIFSFVCLIIAVVIAFVIVKISSPIVDSNSGFATEGQSNSDVQLSDAWEELQVSNAIFEECETDDI